LHDEHDGLATLQLKINGGDAFTVDLYETANGVVGTKTHTKRRFD
jgi:hypothetical protein